MSPTQVAACGANINAAGSAAEEVLQETEARLENGSLKWGIFMVLRKAGPTGVTRFFYTEQRCLILIERVLTQQMQSCIPPHLLRFVCTRALSPASVDRSEFFTNGKTVLCVLVLIAMRAVQVWESQISWRGSSSMALTGEPTHGGASRR